jgi:hypothetical protein
MTGNEYADLIAAYLVKNFSARGVTVYREISLGKTIIGKNRHVDIFVLHAESDRALAIECKYQDSYGTVDEKIPYAIQDMQAMGMPVCLAYAGSGFSDGILHMLAGCPIAAARTRSRSRYRRSLPCTQWPSRRAKATATPSSARRQALSGRARARRAAQSEPRPD